MKRLVLSFLLLGAMAPSNTLLAQENRISMQTGMFHQFFDGTPLYNKDKITNYKHWKFPLYYFGGHFNDSWGFKFQRTLNSKSNISSEYMIYSAVYQPMFSDWNVGPLMDSKRLHRINITYSRNLSLGNKWQFTYGAGINTQWGIERWFITSFGLWESFYQNYYRKDFGLNLRTGVEYAPIKQITIFSYVDFQSTLFLKYPSDGNEDQFPEFFEQHGDEIKASMFDLSLNFGIGYNF